jgi:hypothetical protein
MVPTMLYSPLKVNNSFECRLLLQGIKIYQVRNLKKVTGKKLVN